MGVGSMDGGSTGDVCQALSTQALSAWFQFHCHPALSVGLGSLTIHSQFSHTNSLSAGMSVGGSGAGCQPSVPSVSVLGIDPFFVQYCMVYLYNVGNAAVGAVKLAV